MDASYSTELTQAFVVGEDELKKLIRLLTDRFGTVEIRANCADGVVRTFTTANELFSFENPKSKEIQRLYISARSEDFQKQATIDLSGSRWRGISLEIHARDDVLSRFRSDVLDIIQGMRPWYSRLHRIDFLAISFVAYFLLWIGLLMAVAFKWIPTTETKETNASGTALSQLIVYGGIAILVIVGLLLNRFRDVIFPRAIFLIGQGKSRFQQLERVQWSVVIAFIVSFAAGILIAIWQAFAA